MIIIGIDPGASGGVAVVNPWGRSDAHKMPDTARELAGILHALKTAIGSIKAGSIKAYVEKVHAMPKQGVSSTFKFGYNAGMIEGVLASLGIPYEFVTPIKWQKDLGCLTKGDKNITKRKAQALYPDIKVTHATADALLIATWGARQK